MFPSVHSLPRSEHHTGAHFMKPSFFSEYHHLRRALHAEDGAVTHYGRCRRKGEGILSPSSACSVVPVVLVYSLD